jgi:ABC-type sulfate/molybdate transport systems ATPase subunit
MPETCLARERTPWLEFSIRHQEGAVRLEAEARLRGSLAVLVGPSGAGKTTLLRAIAGLLRPNGSGNGVGSGFVNVGGRTAWRSGTSRWLAPAERGCGLVMQRPALFPALSARENIAFGLHYLTRAEQERRVQEMAALFRLEPFLGRRPSQLSGGEQQRLAVARTLAPRPPVLLLDEPFGGLNMSLKDAILTDLEMWLSAMNTPALYVTHDVAEGWRLGSHPGAEVLRMEAGRIVAQGPAAEVLAEERAQLLRALEEH